MCEYCDPALETDHWVRFGAESTSAFVSFTGGGGKPAPPQLVVRLLLREGSIQNVTGSYDHRMPVNFCPWCGRDLRGESE